MSTVTQLYQIHDLHNAIVHRTTEKIQPDLMHRWGRVHETAIKCIVFIIAKTLKPHIDSTSLIHMKNRYQVIV